MVDMDLLSFLAFYFGVTLTSFVIGVLLHEGGHACAGWLFNFQPRLIRLGIGPVLARFPLHGAFVEWRLFPIAGAVACLPRPAGRVAASIAYLGAGLMINLLLLGSFSAIWSITDEPWALAAAHGQFYLVLLSALPFQKTRRGQTHRSDMLKILRLLREPSLDAVVILQRALMRPVIPADVALSAPGSMTAEILFQASRQDLKSDLWAQRNAFESLSKALDTPIDAQERAFTLDTLTRFVLLYEIETSDEAVDRWSAEAAMLAPSPRVLTNRGAALGLIGRFDEAEALLQAILGDAEEAGIGNLCRAYLRKVRAANKLLALKRAEAERAAADQSSGS